MHEYIKKIKQLALSRARITFIARIAGLMLLDFIVVKIKNRTGQCCGCKRSSVQTGSSMLAFESHHFLEQNWLISLFLFVSIQADQGSSQVN